MKTMAKSRYLEVLKCHRLFMRLMLGFIKTKLKTIWGLRGVVSGPGAP